MDPKWLYFSKCIKAQKLYIWIIIIISVQRRKIPTIVERKFFFKEEIGKGIGPTWFSNAILHFFCIYIKVHELTPHMSYLRIQALGGVRIDPLTWGPRKKCSYSLSILRATLHIKGYINEHMGKESRRYQDSILAS